MVTGKRILTVDDSAAIRVFLVELLAEYGAELEEAASGAEVLALLESGKRYDIVLLDLILPDTDGYDLLKKIREVDAETTIIMITGMGSIKSATEAVRAGADGYVEKQHLVAGTDENELLYALQQSLEHREGVIARQQLDAVRADFYSMVTHDLRTPAGNIVASLQLLLKGKAGEVNDRQRELIEVSVRSARKLLALVNDYLDFAKIDAGYMRLHLSPTDLGVVLSRSVNANAPQAAARGQELAISIPANPVRIFADEERLEQVCDNLLSNAIKYTPDGGRIEASLSVQGHEAWISVKDSGRGIAPDALPSLFTKYNRVPGEATRGVEGTGLGLLIVKEIVHGHGGEVAVDSQGKDQGSSFTVKLPVREA